MYRLSDRILFFYEESQESKKLTNDVRIKSRFTITVIACLVFAVKPSSPETILKTLLTNEKVRCLI